MSGGAEPTSLADLRAMGSGELRRLLSGKGVNTSGCIEKADYVNLAAETLRLDDGDQSRAATANGQGAAGGTATGGGLGAGSNTAAPAAAEGAAPVAGAAPSNSSAKIPGTFETEVVQLHLPASPSRSLFTDVSTSPSPSPSPSKSESSGESRYFDGRPRRKAKDYGVEMIYLSGNDAATLSMNNRTLDKIARAADAEVELIELSTLEVRGSVTQRRRAKKYVDIYIKQRMGSLFITEDMDEGDITVLMVPPDVVGYVQGHGGGVLRSIEDEWGTLMFFIDTDLSRAQRLAILGSIRGRRGSELKVLSAVEMKLPGYFNQIQQDVLQRDVGKDKSGTWGTDVQTFKDEGDISYALGKQGGTRRKLERSSGAIVQYIGMVAVFSGKKDERVRVREYMRWLFQQLEGPVYVRGWETRTDCTVVDVPNDCVGYITGNRRSTLGVMEEEWGTLMFFMSETGEKGRGRGAVTEKLAIFGAPRARRGSELKVMSGIETKSPGFFTRGVRNKTSDKRSFDTDRYVFRDEEVSYALGKDGATRKKLEAASGAILQYVGNVAFIAGTQKERQRCREFIDWLLQQRRGSVTISDASQRDDCTEVTIPSNCKGWVTGNRGSELRRMEQVTGTYMFMALDSKGKERLLIFGINAGTRTGDGGRNHAERLVNAMIEEKQRYGGEDSRSPSARRDKRRSSRSRSGSAQGKGRGRRSRSRSRAGIFRRSSSR
mmetsp:Transcript_65800/g.157238  ORF Transcript_65800/g.157238 Transcript_65800/m.157238 type:complete len:717 (-) Transcript_65800:5-2155(-)